MPETLDTKEGGVERSGPGEGAIGRLDAVQRLTEAGLAYLDLDDLLEEVLQRVVEILEVDTAAVLLVEDDGETLAARAASGLEEEVEQGFRLPIGKGFAGRIAATQSPVAIPDLDDSPIKVVNPLMREKGIRSLLGVPLVVEGELIGVLHVGSLTRRDFAESESELLRLVGDRVGLSIEHARFAGQHNVAETLQRSLLPRRLPSVPGLNLAARYVAGAAGTKVGGDWYDAIELGHRYLGFAIGDVAGRGLGAAIAMGQLRSALRAYALSGDQPSDIVGRLARFADAEGMPMVTLIYATLDLETLQLDYTRAGHPYPLLVHSDGTSLYLEDGGDTPLGTGQLNYGQQQSGLRPGDTLLLYTDGLIERRGERLSDGEDRLAAAGAHAPPHIELRCDSILDQLTEGAEIPDDIAMLAVQAVGLSGEFEFSIPAQRNELQRVRHLLRRWLADHGATEEDCSAFALAATEACANAVEHAYGPVDAAIHVKAMLAEDVVTVTIRDRGSWRRPADLDRGRGILLMRNFMDSVEFARLEEGTTVQLRRQIRTETDA